MKIIPLLKDDNDNGNNGNESTSNRLMIGFNFLNHFEMTTIFETFQL